jgi:hypothetical protein
VRGWRRPSRPLVWAEAWLRAGKAPARILRRLSAGADQEMTPIVQLTRSAWPPPRARTLATLFRGAFACGGALEQVARRSSWRAADQQGRPRCGCLLIATYQQLKRAAGGRLHRSQWHAHRLLSDRTTRLAPGPP